MEIINNAKMSCHSTSENLKSFLKQAEAAARKQMKRMGRPIVNGMTSEDFAIEAYIYISSHGQDMNYITRRAKLIVIDNHRKDSGRRIGAKRARYNGNLSDTSDIRVKACANKLEIPADLPYSIKMICEGLALGQNRNAIASRLGIHPGSIRRITRKNKSLIERIVL